MRIQYSKRRMGEEKEGRCMRKREMFEPNYVECRNIVMSKVSELYKQERDWTCSVACIRTILSGYVDKVEDEDYFVSTYKLKPGPYYSKDVKKLKILKAYDVVYGCDCINVSFDVLLTLMENGYSIMVESMYNYAHWFVILGYYPLREKDVEKSMLLVYDPYYDEVRLIRADEFINMWIDGNYVNTKIEKDFIAIRNK